MLVATHIGRSHLAAGHTHSGKPRDLTNRMDVVISQSTLSENQIYSFFNSNVLFFNTAHPPTVPPTPHSPRIPLYRTPHRFPLYPTPPPTHSHTRRG